MEKGKIPANFSKPKQYIKNAKYAPKGYEKHNVIEEMISKAEGIMADNQLKD